MENKDKNDEKGGGCLCLCSHPQGWSSSTGGNFLLIHYCDCDDDTFNCENDTFDCENDTFNCDNDTFNCDNNTYYSDNCDGSFHYI